MRRLASGIHVTVGDVGGPMGSWVTQPADQDVPAVPLSANRLPGNVPLQFVDIVSIIT